MCSLYVSQMNLNFRNMNKIYIVLLLLISPGAFSQINYGLKQQLENATGMGYHMQVYGSDMFVSKSSKDEVNIYTRQTDGTWVFLQTLKPTDKPATTSKDWGFGNSMAINENYAVITATYKDLIRENAGGVYFYRKGSDGLWQGESIVENPTTFSYYAGKNVAIHKNKVTLSHNNGYPRFVHIFERNSNGIWAISDTITETQFRGIDGKKSFYNDTTFIAMSFQFDDQKVKEFRLQPNGNWVNTQTLETGVTTHDTYFGAFLSVDNNQHMAIGAAYFDVPGSDQTLLNSAGKVFIYKRVNNVWTLQQEIVSPASQANESFGSDVLIKGDILLITAKYTRDAEKNTTGALYIYKRMNGVWTLAQTYYSETRNQIGNNVFFENNQIISFGYNGIHILENLKDCQGVSGGAAKLNSCDICYEGTTGLNLSQSEAQCISTSIDLTLSDVKVIVSPNPFDNQINIQTPDNAKIYLIDCYGRLLASDISSGLFDTGHLKSGMYFLVVENEGKKQTIKIIKK